MNTFAGFWRDGAVVKPEERHWDMDSTVLAKHKMDGTFDICGIGYSGWNSVYWLDTTTPTELTPQEAFELLKTITPTLERIEKQGNLYSAYADERISIINWGSTTEYPPRERWRVPTDADKGKPCRVKEHQHHLWTGDSNNLKYQSQTDSGWFIVEHENGYPQGFRYCEVLE